MRPIALRAIPRPLFSHVTTTISPRRQLVASFSTQLLLQKKDTLPPRPKVAEEETFKRYLKGSGPGGQKINKTSSAVQLTHLPTGIVVKSQATRSRSQNENIARRILAEKVELLEKGSESRVEKKRERDSLKRRSAEKKRRRKYRAIAEEKDKQQRVEEEEDNDDNDDAAFEEHDIGRQGQVKHETRHEHVYVNTSEAGQRSH